MSGPLKQYLFLIAKGSLRKDSHQLKTVNILQTLHDEISTFKPTNVSSWWRFSSPNPAPLGLYLYGDVGTGKVTPFFFFLLYPLLPVFASSIFNASLNLLTFLDYDDGPLIQ
jgi:predicted ATPase